MKTGDQSKECVVRRYSYFGTGSGVLVTNGPCPVDAEGGGGDRAGWL